ncbi:tetraacyldisaccharide 4'-kinase [bacterium]|nr:tetraacyldisaccharide 4'-kinase [bacterium]
MPNSFMIYSPRNLSEKLEILWGKIISSEGKVLFKCFRFILDLLTFPYLIGFYLFRLIQNLNSLKVSRPVISVGNITLGGTGKTSLTIYLAKKIEARGYKVAVLCTGYKGKRIGKVEGNNCLDIGDEPYLIRRNLKRGDVWLGRNRLRAAIEALSEGADVIILDDGMQYFRLRKDLEIAMLNALCPFGYGHLFPRGALREPLTGLKRADVIILNNADFDSNRFLIRKIVSEINPRALYLEANYKPRNLVNLYNGDILPLDWLKGKRIMGMAGIGFPWIFKGTLERLANEVVFIPFPDHHFYTTNELLALQEKAIRERCEALVVTEKDGVKIEGLLRRGLKMELPFYALSVQLEIEDEDKLWEKVDQILMPKDS